MSNAAIKHQAITEEAHHLLNTLQNPTHGLLTASQTEPARHSGEAWPSDDQALAHRLVSQPPGDDRFLNARQVAEKLGVSERFIRDHTTRRSPRIPAVKLGKLIRYRPTDIDLFMAELGTLPSSRRSRFGV
jgi:hypothetical protein